MYLAHGYELLCQWVRQPAFLAVAVLLTGCASVGLQSRDQGAYIPVSQRTPTSEIEKGAKIHTELAGAYFADSQIQTAQEEVTVALAYDTSYAPAHSMQGLIYMRLGDLARADASFAKARRLEPRDPNIANNYGWYLCNTGRSQKGFSMVKQALDSPLYQTPVRAIVNIGDCHLHSGDLNQATTSYQRALVLSDNNNVLAHLGLARVDYKRGQYADSLRKSQAMLSKYGASPGVLWQALISARGMQDTNTEMRFAAQLKNRFPRSIEYQWFIQGRKE